MVARFLRQKLEVLFWLWSMQFLTIGLGYGWKRIPPALFKLFTNLLLFQFILEIAGIIVLIKVWWLFALIFFVKGIVVQTALQLWDMTLLTLFGSTFYLLYCWWTLCETDMDNPISDSLSFFCFCFCFFLFLSVSFFVLRVLT